MVQQERNSFVGPRIRNEEFSQDAGKRIPSLMLAKVLIHGIVRDIARAGALVMAGDDKRVAFKKRKADVEMYPDAWDRFRSAVHTMTKAGPQHRTAANQQAKSSARKKKPQPQR
jgi:hypothetical protein